MHYVFASCFMSVPLETAKTTNEEKLAEVNQKIEELKNTKNENMKVIDVLKRTLSNKFGDRVSLEE